MRPVLASLLLLGLFLGPHDGGRGRAEELSGAPPTAIRRSDLDRRLRALTADAFAGREAGTEGARGAADYIAGEFARAGLQPAGRDGSYMQPFGTGRPRLGSPSLLEIQTPAGVRTVPVGDAFQPFSMSRPADVRGGVTFAGYGITAKERKWTRATGEEVVGWDDYEGLDVRGRVVIVLRKDPGWGDVRLAAFRAKVENAAAHGAIGLLLCNDVGTIQAGPDRLLAWDAPSGLPTASGPLPCAFVSRALVASMLGIGASDLHAAEVALQGLGPNPRDAEGVEVRLATNVARSAELDARNVVGFLPGKDPALRQDVVMVGAHFDHLGRGRFGSLGGAAAQGRIHPGADDNGSGCAALLELAEYFAAPEHRPRRSLLFIAFSGEEMGLLGSTHYVREPLRPLAQTVAFVNLDMIGRLTNDTLHVIGVGTAAGLDAVVRKANEEVGLTLRLDPQGAAGSDSLPFFRRRIPVLFFFTGLHGDYHRVSDTVERIEFGGLERVTHVVRGVVERLADVVPAPSFTDPPPRRRPPILGLSLAGDAPIGVRVAALTPGGAAEAAGLAVGDVVLALAEKPVADARDLRAVLSTLEAGRAVDILVLRDRERLRLQIVPRARAQGRRR